LGELEVYLGCTRRGVRGHNARGASPEQHVAVLVQQVVAVEHVVAAEQGRIHSARHVIH